MPAPMILILVLKKFSKGGMALVCDYIEHAQTINTSSIDFLTVEDV